MLDIIIEEKRKYGGFNAELMRGVILCREQEQNIKFADNEEKYKQLLKNKKLTKIK